MDKFEINLVITDSWKIAKKLDPDTEHYMDYTFEATWEKRVIHPSVVDWYVSNAN